MSRASMDREAVFAGSWYPGTAAELERFLAGATPASPPAPPAATALALVAPHAGYRFSGAIAAETYGRVSVPGTAIVLCPNHRVPPPVLAVWERGAWRTPLGPLSVDEELAARLLDEARPLLRADTYPHEKEHAVELQLPLLRFRRPDVKIVPIVVASDSKEELAAFGRAIARAVAERPPGSVLVVSSSDMNHFESAAVAARKDRLAIERILALDPDGLVDVVEEESITMCGVRPTAVALHAAKALGARRAELVRYGHSGEVSGDDGSVVGYAGLVIS